MTDELAGAVDALAGRLARVPPDVMAPTKLMRNRAMDAAEFAAAVEVGLDLQSFHEHERDRLRVRRDRPSRRPEGRACLARPALRGAARGWLPGDVTDANIRVRLTDLTNQPSKNSSSRASLSP